MRRGQWELTAAENSYGSPKSFRLLLLQLKPAAVLRFGIRLAFEGIHQHGMQTTDWLD